MVDEMLVCRVDVLGRLSMEPDRPGRETGGAFPAARGVLALGRAVGGFSVMVPDSRMLPWPVGDGNWVSLKSVDADSRLLWRSSKLTEGKKS